MRNKDIFDKLQDAYGEGCVSYTWVSKWAKAFREGRISFADDFRSGRPPILNGVERICAKIKCWPYQSGSAIARNLGLSKIYVLEVLKKVLQMKKHSLCSVLHTLNNDQKAVKVEMRASMLSIREPLIAHSRS
jgi:transposase